MKFKPSTKEELSLKNLLPKAWYDFEVMTAVNKTSKAGNEMIEAKLRVFAPDGSERHVYDYLMEAMPDKLFAFCDAVGLVDKYSTGTLDAVDCVGRSAKVKLAIDDKNGDYPPKNVAKSYATVDAVGPAPDQLAPDDDEIPF